MDIRSFFQKKAPDASNKSAVSVLRGAKRSSPSKASEKVNPQSSSSPPALKKLKKEKPAPTKSISDVPSDSETKENKEKSVKVKKVDSNNQASNPAVVIPRGTPGSLDNLNFVFSGVLPSITREAAMDIVRRCGGNVMSKVSGRTNYLVVGDILETGEPVTSGSKYQAATEKSVSILHQDAFFKLINESSAKKRALKPASKPVKSSTTTTTTTTTSQLWPDKHRPKSSKDLIGNKMIIQRLKTWISDWNAVHLKKSKKVKFNSKLSENAGAKMALLSGPPGIGKSSLAAIASRECGFDVTEMNASDVRSKKSLKGIADVLQNTMISFGKKNVLKKRLLIFDEVDGMSSGDRGGIVELIALLKTTRVPIICICNDRQSPKIRSLANHSYDLRFRRPTKVEIAARCLQIATSEGMEVERNALVEVIEKFGNDIRQVLNFLQMWKRKSDSMTYDDIKQHFHQMEKDSSLRLNPFDATQRIFAKDLNLYERNEAYFVDYDLMPLMVQENYVSSIRNNKYPQEVALDRIVAASEFIAEADVLGAYVRGKMRWDLLTKQAAMNVAAAIEAKGFLGRTEFSRWLGKNSTTGKSIRLVQDLSVHLRSNSTASFQAVRMDYVPYMREILLTKLRGGSVENIDDIITSLDECNLSREELVESLEHFNFPEVERITYASMDSKLKKNFTMRYNKASHRGQLLVESSLMSAKPKKVKAKANDTDSVLDKDNEANAVSEAESEDDDVSAFKAKKPKKKAAATKTKGKGKGRLKK